MIIIAFAVASLINVILSTLKSVIQLKEEERLPASLTQSLMVSTHLLLNKSLKLNFGFLSLSQLQATWLVSISHSQSQKNFKKKNFGKSQLQFSQKI